MSDEQIELLRAILAELKANGEATREFRAEVQASAVRENGESARMRNAWYAEVAHSRDYRRSSMMLIQAMIAILVLLLGALGAIAAWKLR